MNVQPGATYEAVVDWGITGQTLGLRVIDNAGNTTVARLTTNITEYPAGSGIYARTGNIAPSSEGQYTIVWDDGTSYATEDLLVQGLQSSAIVPATGNLYVGQDTLKATLSLTGQSYADADILSALEAASRAVDNYTNRKFFIDSGSTTTRYYTPESWWLTIIDDAISVNTLQLDSSGNGSFPITVSSSYYTLEPLNSPLDGFPYTSIRIRQTSGQFFYDYYNSVKVTGQFGWSSVPGPVVDATSILAARLLKRKREAPLGVYGFGLDGAVVRISRVEDPDICMLLDPYSRNRPFL